MYTDEYFMQLALELAKKAYYEDEIPVGALIVKENKIIGQGYNQKDTEKLVTKHAELIAIEEASKNINDWRLNDCVIYVTLEPCPMCASAIQQSRIKKVIYGCSSNVIGNETIITNILQNKNYNHQTLIKKGILHENCSILIKNFFKNKRLKLFPGK